MADFLTFFLYLFFARQTCNDYLPHTFWTVLFLFAAIHCTIGLTVNFDSMAVCFHGISRSTFLKWKITRFPFLRCAVWLWVTFIGYHELSTLSGRSQTMNVWSNDLHDILIRYELKITNFYCPPGRYNTRNVHEINGIVVFGVIGFFFYSILCDCTILHMKKKLLKPYPKTAFNNLRFYFAL